MISGMCLEQHVFKRDEVGVLAKQPEAAIGAVENVIDHSAGRHTGDARHRGRLIRAVLNVKGRVPFSYPYTALGQQSTVTDDSGLTTYTYDAAGNMIEAQTPEGTINFKYDNLNQEIEMWTGTGSYSTAPTATTYEYDDAGRLSSVTETRLNNQTIDLVTSYSYDADGNLAHEILPNDITTDYTYDDENRLTDEVQKNEAGTTVYSESLTLNDNGTIHSSAENQMLSNGTVDLITSNYGYDADDLLKSVSVTHTIQTGDNYTDSYTYDLDGNQLTDDHTGPGGGPTSTTTNVYNNNDELTSSTVAVSGGSTTITTNSYDTNGSLIYSASTVGSSTTTLTYGYDLRNKMNSYSVNGTLDASYVYDDAGNRVQETTGGVTSFYLTDTQNPTGYAQPIETWTVTANGSLANASLAMTYLIGNTVLGQVAGPIGTTPAPTYFLTDRHGSVRATASSSTTNNITATFNYSAFGGAIGFTPSAQSAPIFLFGGDAVFDAVSGLYMNGDGTRDRMGFEFIQMDPTSGNQMDPISLHKYLYAGDNPVMFNDPSGHDFSLAELVIDAGISSILGTIASPIIKPATSYIASNLLLPAGFLQKLQSTLPDAWVIQTPLSASFTEGNELGFGGTVGGGVEVAISRKNHNLAAYGFAYAGLSFGSQANASGSIGDFGVGAFWSAGGGTSEDYTGPAFVFDFPLEFVSSAIQSALAKVLTQGYAPIALGITRGLSGDPELADAAGTALSLIPQGANALARAFNNAYLEVYYWADGSFGINVDFSPFNLGGDVGSHITGAIAATGQIYPSDYIPF
jgi:YD repeat-containing protein